MASPIFTGRYTTENTKDIILAIRGRLACLC